MQKSIDDLKNVEKLEGKKVVKEDGKKAEELIQEAERKNEQKDKAKRILMKDQQERTARVWEGLEKLLKKENCRIYMQITLTNDGKILPHLDFPANAN